MEPLSRPRAHALLHFTVLLWGATAILGKGITIAALPLVFYRVVIVSALMAAVLVVRRVPFRVSLRRAAHLAGAGALVAAHWILFYGTIKLAGVALAVVCLSTVTFFTALLEPLIFRRPASRHELTLGALVVVGVVLLLHLEVRGTTLSYVMGLGSAFFSAAFGTLNGKLAHDERAERMTFYELTAAALVCALGFVAFGGFVPPWAVTAKDWLFLGVLAVFCTLLPWLWSLRILRTLSPYTVAISVSLEPVYSIALAYVLWPDEERLSARFYAGTTLLFLIVAANALLKRRA